jgi:hypothetical protein
MTIYTFDLFWAKFHEVNKQRKINKVLASHLYERCISLESKRKLFKSLNDGEKTNLSAYEYIKLNLKF